MFGKKPLYSEDELDLQLADVLEDILCKGNYDPSSIVTRWMRCILTDMWRHDLISKELSEHGSRRILDYIDVNCRSNIHVTTMFGLLLYADDVKQHTNYFEWRIHGSNHYWKLIRQLRKQPPLEVI